MAGGNLREVNVPDPADPGLICASTDSDDIGSLDNDHIATTALIRLPLKEAARCSPPGPGNNDFNKLVTEGEDTILQAESAHTGINEGRPEAKHLLKPLNILAVMRREDQLT